MVNPARLAPGLIIAACFAFIGLTIAAMVAYPGGTFVNPHTRGYLFFENFFSDLGMTRAFNGAANLISMPLFVLALFCAGGGLILFFARFATRFPGQRTISRVGSASGMITGFCFFGIALTPQDLISDIHDLFSVAAFLFLLLASLVYVIVIARTPAYPKKFAFVFGALALFLLTYITLFLFGLPLTTRAGMVIQATGQKLIVYAAILCLLIQTRGAPRIN